MEDQPTPTEYPVAATAGEEDHSDPALFTGHIADAPQDRGRPPDVAHEPGHHITDALLLPEDD